MKLDEDQIRAKVIELLDGCCVARMDAWMISGIIAGVLDADLVERVLNEEIHLRSQEVRRFWCGGCNCDGRWN